MYVPVTNTLMSLETYGSSVLLAVNGPIVLIHCARLTQRTAKKILHLCKPASTHSVTATGGPRGVASSQRGVAKQRGPFVNSK